MSTDEVVVTRAALEEALQAIHITTSDGEDVTFDKTFVDSVFIELQRLARAAADPTDA